MPLLNKQRILQFLRRPLEIVVLRYIFGIMILAPTIMFVAWVLTTKKPLQVAVINKSVPDMERTEHAALFWMLKHQRVVNEQGEFYDKYSDYFGFHPRLGWDFVLNDFDDMDSLELDSMVQGLDLAYYADAYGVYSHDYGGDPADRNQLLYGGVSDSDLEFLKHAQHHELPVITEFSLFGTPTTRHARAALDSLFGVRSSGWLGRYFKSLDTTGQHALPEWVVDLYLKKYEEWPFWDSGIVLVRGADIVILEYGTHLLVETLLIETQDVYAQQYDLPPRVAYPFWFDIVGSPSRENRVVSIFHLPVNEAGAEILEIHDIPEMFPAVLHHPGPGQVYYYFAGDFSDNPVADHTAHFKGIALFQSFFYDRNRADDRRQFFWLYYRPLMRTILAQL